MSFVELLTGNFQPDRNQPGGSAGTGYKFPALPANTTFRAAPIPNFDGGNAPGDGRGSGSGGDVGGSQDPYTGQAPVTGGPTHGDIDSLVRAMFNNRRMAGFNR